MSASVKSVYLEDFQSHSKTKIELAPPGGLTILVGKTDSGKTAIVRGLRLLHFNVPLGVEYIRVGRNMATVAEELSDGTKVVRERSKSVNRYRVVKQDGSSQVFEGFGNSVPLEVQQATGVRTVSVGENLDLALNLSEQLDGPFLGNKTVSGPLRAKALGKLAGTEEIDKAQSLLGEDLYHAGQDKNRLAGEIDVLDGRIAEYGWLPTLKTTIEATETLVAKIKAAEERRGKLVTLRSSLNDVAARELIQQRILNRWASLDRVELVVATKIEPTVSKVRTLALANAGLEKVSADTAAWRRIADKWIRVDDAAKMYAVLEVSITQAAKLRDLRSSLTTTSRSIATADANLAKWQGVGEASAVAAAVDSALAKGATLFGLWKDLASNAGAQRTQEAALARWAGLDRASAIMEAVTASGNKGDLFRNLLGSIQDNAERQIAESRRMARFAGVEEASARIFHVESSIGKVTVLRSLSQQVTRVRQAQVVAEDAFEKQSQATADAERLYADTLISLGTCPLCGSTVNPELFKEVAS